MNAIASGWLRRFGWLVCAGLMVWCAGCASQPRVDWANRIGTYTFDQAVLEQGPPDKQAKLQDGTLVAEWLTQRGYSYAYPAFGYDSWYHWPYYPAYSVGSSPNYYLRLTFGPDGKLTAWKKFAR